MLVYLDVAIGLAFIFSLVALLCSLLNEWISALAARRGRMLWQGIDHLIGDALSGDLQRHPLVEGLVHRTWFDRVWVLSRFRRRCRPSYLPSEVFVTALVDLVGSPAGGDMPTTFTALRAAVDKLPDSDARRALLALVDDADGDLEAAKSAIGRWFDAGMDRVSGWYKRWSQLVLFVLGLIVAMSFGVDSLLIGKTLWNEPLLRDELVEQAGTFLEERAQADESATAEAAGEAAGAPEQPAGDAQGGGQPAAPAAGEETSGGGAAAVDDGAANGAANSEAPGDGGGAPGAGDQTAAGDDTSGDQPRDLTQIRADYEEAAELLEGLRLPLVPPELSDPDSAVREEFTAAQMQKPVDERKSSGCWNVFWFWLATHGLGFLLTACAAALGAPFWFDALARLMSLRATFKKPTADPAPNRTPAAGLASAPPAPAPAAPPAQEGGTAPDGT
jgi:hypothetical protein